jgi:hypothetical protein
MAATFALKPSDETGSADVRESERAARLAGYVDKRMLEIDVKREFTEQQEYDRMLAALAGVFEAAPLAALMADGSLLKEERAIDLALSAGS